jgi:hypothetical protein
MKGGKWKETNRECAHDREDDVQGGEDGKCVAPVDRHGLALSYVDDQVGGDKEAA